MVPRPDYPSRALMWRNMITKCGGRITDAMDLSSLAKISDGFTAGHINAVATEILSEYRIQQVRGKELLVS